MKRKYIHMSMLIEGPKQPGNDINLYLGLLKEELDTLWKTPANTWDAAEKEYFPMRAALLTTVHDYLGYGYLLLCNRPCVTLTLSGVYLNRRVLVRRTTITYNHTIG